MPQISIIMPVYNSEVFISDTIKSIINQTYQDWELIIVDDCSRDNSTGIINNLKNEKIMLLKNERHLGAASSRNKAINRSKGRYIAFIDSDDLWEKDKLEKQREFMVKQDIAFSFSSYRRIRENGEVLGEVKAPENVNFSDILKNTPIQISTVMVDTLKIKKECIQFQNTKTCEDVAFYLNILKDGIIARGIEECLVNYKVRKNSLSSNRIANTIRRWKIYKQFDVCFADRCTNIIEHIKNAIIRTLPIVKIKRLKEIIKLLDIMQLLDVILFPIIFIISLLSKPFCKSIWIIEENSNEACDNGYIFYKYLRTKRKDINAYYVINKKSKDYNKIKNLGNIIGHRSLKHWIYYLNAEKIIVTQKYANPSMALFYVLHTKNIIKNPRIFLQHGVIINNSPMFFYNRTNFRLFICGAKREYNYIKEKFGYPSENVVYTGLARFDALDLNSNKNNFILFAPTWRKWIKSQIDFDSFMENYYKLLDNEDLKKLIEENNINLKFVLHKNMKKFKIKKEFICKNIEVCHNEEVDIQNLINRTDLLITDYSSIFMDIAYRKRPIIYYQFDKKEYKSKQLETGYFSYEKDGFGDVIEEPINVINKIKYYVKNDYKIEEDYSKKMIDFFERKDKDNCKRILEEIEKI